MPIYNSKKFPESALAHQLLDGLVGVEIGGAAHNAFGLDTINVDRVHHTDPAFKPYADEQIRLCGEVMPVDVVAPGNRLPFPDKSYDFVISSHVIEHFYDPISAAKEWMRVARQYVYIICPQRDALESDREKPLTELEEHIARFEFSQKKQAFISRKATPKETIEFMADATFVVAESDTHHSRWTAQSFIQMCWWVFAQEWGNGWEVCKAQERDDKVGNGFCVVLKHVEEKIDWHQEALRQNKDKVFRKK